MKNSDLFIKFYNYEISKSPKIFEKLIILNI